MTTRIVSDRLESDDLAAQSGTTGSDLGVAGDTLKGYTDEVEAAVAEVFELVRPLIEETIATATTTFTTLDTRFVDSSNEGAFQAAAATAVADGRVAFEQVLTAAAEDEAATEAAVVQTIADYVARTITNVQTPAQNVNEALTSLGTAVSTQQSSIEDLDAASAGSIGAIA
jgi:hypothetical protein